MPDIEVRPAIAEDAAGIAHVHVQAWREAYALQLPAELLAGLEEAPRAVRWAESIQDDVTDVFVAAKDGRIVGWASASAGRDEDAPLGRELEGIYILQEVYGTGGGQRLLDMAIGAEPAYLWILDGNPRAEAFYRKNGFDRDGVERDGRMSGHPVHIVRMTRR